MSAQTFPRGSSPHDVLFEVTEEEFARCSSVRRAVFGLVFVVSLGTMAALLFAWSLTTGQLSVSQALASLPPFIVVALIAYVEYRSLRSLNRFCISTWGIAPPVKPSGSRMNRRERLFVPLSSIARFQYRQYGEGYESTDHFEAILESREGNRIAINDSMIAGQVGKHPERIMEARRILEELVHRFEPAYQ